MLFTDHQGQSGKWRALAKEVVARKLGAEIARSGRPKSPAGVPLFRTRKSSATESTRAGFGDHVPWRQSKPTRRREARNHTDECERAKAERGWGVVS